MGFPHPTYDVPSHDEALAALAASAAVDPLGHAGLLAAGLRGDDVPPGHVCATAWVLDPTGARTLLVQHRSLGWVEPGGHVERGEDPAAAAVRELHEETGVLASPVLGRPAVVHAGPFPASGGGPAHHHWNLGYLFVVDLSAELVPEPGAPVRWFAVDDLPRPAVEDLVAVLPPLQQLLRGLRQP